MSGRIGFTALVSLVLLALSPGEARAQGPPDGQLTIAFDASIAPAFLDPAETAGLGTPFTFLYALHDALIKPLPGNDMAPCLAEAWSESADGLTYDFKLREGLKFHNGDPFTADDVKFSFERYRGTSAKLLHDRVKSVDIIDPHRVRFTLHKPWADFLVFYATPATGAAWIVPKKYIEASRLEAFVVTGSAYRLRRLSGHRRSVPAAGAGARPQEARGALASDPAADPRARHARADLRAGDAPRGGPARGGARHRAQPASLHGRAL
jgi:ABC-type transport system substrate-binding protein